jgi:hypothetical protein
VLAKLEIETIEGMVFPEDSRLSEEQCLAISTSNKIIEYLKNKGHTHNKLHPNDRTNIIQLKKVFLNTPVTEGSNIIPQGIAHVNNFLKLKRNDFEKALYDSSLNLILSEDQIKTAQKELEGSILHNLYISYMDELYIEDYKKTKTSHWFEV